LAEEEEIFRDLLDYIRDAVLGMSNGLVEVLSVTAGLAGAYGNPLSIAIGGTDVGIASALSMGIGAFTSVRAKMQIRQGIFTRIRLAAEYVSHILHRRVVEYMRRKGFSKNTAKTVADETLKKKETIRESSCRRKIWIKRRKTRSTGQGWFIHWLVLHY